MRATPFQVTLRRCEAWQRVVGWLAAVAIATPLAWLLTLERPWPPVAPLLALVFIAMTFWLAGRLRAVPRAVIRWDGRSWFVHLPTGTPCAGGLGVALDLGDWMLLRYAPDPGAPAARPLWLPVQRQGLDVPWHALRCAVYTPRPALQPVEPP